MNVTCPECQSVYRVDPAKVTGASLRARCSICGGLIPVGASVRWADDFPSEMATPGSPGSLGALGSAGARGDAAVAVPPPRFATPVLPSPEVAARPDTSSRRPLASDALVVAPPVARPPEGASREGGLSRVPPFGSGRRPTPLTPPSTGATAVPPVSAPVPRQPTPAFVPPASGTGAMPAPGRAGIPAAPAIPAPPMPKPPAPPPPASTPAPFVPPAPAGAGAPTRPASSPAVAPHAAAPAGAPSPGAASPGGARRPINPFLSNDPNQKARRLARALVSDMVAYHPQRREEGARAGTLKQLFREEIKKSYEEYVEQVGREFAESTAHFQEALNDILAGGKRIF